MSPRQKEKRRQEMRLLKRKNPVAWLEKKRAENRRHCAAYARRHPDKVAARVRRWQIRNANRVRKQRRLRYQAAINAQIEAAGQMSLPIDQQSAPAPASARGTAE